MIYFKLKLIACSHRAHLNGYNLQMSDLLGFAPSETASILVTSSESIAATCAFIRKGLFSESKSSQKLVVLAEPETRQVKKFLTGLDLVRAQSKSLADILNEIQGKLRKDQKTDVIIFTLTSIGLENSEQSVAKFVLSLKNNPQIGLVIAVNISHFQSISAEHRQRKLFQTTLNLQRKEEDCLTLLKISHAPKIGKGLERVVHLKIDPEAENIIKIDHPKAKDKSTVQAPQDEDKDEAALKKLTTFNLGLKESERQAKEKVVLPYWREEQKKHLNQGEEKDEEVVRINKKKGAAEPTIYYEPDEGDDWDEEDPDDDLDF